MYKDFYSLKENPFNLTPSPRFLYLSEGHKEALALLTYGVVERKGFILLTGEVGTGKTTMVQALLSNLDESVQCVNISNPLLSPMDFMNYLAFSAFKKKVHFKSKADFLLEFEEFLHQCLQHQENFILIIDEAQKLSFELLEEIRLLSNMESADEKLINIFLVGQPEINEKLRDPRCRPLLQRINTRYHIPPLDAEETREYMITRLKIAGAKDEYGIFTRSAIKAIHQYSEGYPRVINNLADNSLLLGYSKGKQKITPAMIKRCYEDMSLSGSFSKSSQERPESTEIKTVKPITTRRYWRWAAVLIFGIALVALLMSQKGRNILRQFLKIVPVSHQAPVDKATKKQGLLKGEEDQAKKDTASKNKTEEQAYTGVQTKKEKEKKAHISKAKKEEVLVKKKEGQGKNVITVKIIMEDKVYPDVQTEEKEAFSVDVAKPEESEQMEDFSPEKNKELFQTVIVKDGDTLAQLAIDFYGRADEDILKLIRLHNTKIRNINIIRVGQKLIFPPLTLLDQGPAYPGRE